MVMVRCVLGDDLILSFHGTLWRHYSSPGSWWWWLVEMVEIRTYANNIPTTFNRNGLIHRRYKVKVVSFPTQNKL